MTADNKALVDRLLTMADSDMVPMENAMNLLREAAAALSPQADKARGEVAAWRFKHDGRWVYTETPQRAVERAHGFEPAQALYATPQPQGDASPQVSGGGEVFRALVAKWREHGQREHELSQDKEWSEWVRDRHHGASGAFSQCVLELEAAMSAPQARPDNGSLDQLLVLLGLNGITVYGGTHGDPWTLGKQARPDGGDFYDILYGAKITLILNAGDDASGEVPLTAGATVGTESDLTILCHAEKDGKPITLSVVPQADVARLVEAAKRVDQSYRFEAPDPSNVFCQVQQDALQDLGEALAPFIAAQQEKE